MPEMKCPNCGVMVEGEDFDRPADCYVCECGESWVDREGWANRKAGQADMMRKAQKEGGI
jgi:hypothetical protein